MFLRNVLSAIASHIHKKPLAVYQFPNYYYISRRFLSLTIFCCVSILCIVSCDITPEQKETPSSAINLQDATGHRLALDGPAQRIVSLAPNLTEMIFALGAGNRVIGRTTYADYPPEVLQVEIVGDYKTPNFERIIALKPDLVLMTIAGNEERHYKKMQDLGLNVFAMDAANVEGVINTLDTMGLLLGTPERAETLTQSLRSTIDSIKELAATAPLVSTFIVIDKSPLITVSSGFIAEQIEIAGGRNIAAGAVTTYPTFNREELIRLNPETIIVPAGAESDIEELLDMYPEWKELQAVQSGRIYMIPYDLIARPGPRIAQSIATLYSLLHSHKKNGFM